MPSAPLLPILAPLLPQGDLGRWAALAIAVALLVAGRRLFWVFVGALGFGAGFLAAWTYLPVTDEWLALGLAILAGSLGALVAVFLQKAAVMLVGFVVGALAAWTVLSALGVDSQLWLVGGTVVACFLFVLLSLKVFDLALMIVSSLAGARLLLEAGAWAPPFDGLLAFAVLTLAGVALQWGTRTRRRNRGKKAG